jgi:gliding motility-associated-like protein
MDHPFFKRVVNFSQAIKFSQGLLLALLTTASVAQNSMIGDGFGGRLWYRPTNYTVGSYSAFSLCYSDPCDSSSNQLYGWGGDNVGELGDGQIGNCSYVPVAIPGMNNVRYFSTGYWMGVIRNDGTGWVWGIGGSGGFTVPTQVITDVKFVDASGALASFVKNDGTVWSIGYNEFGQFGDGTTTSNYNTAVQMNGVSNAVRVAVGLRASYVLLADSSVLSVGSNESGLLGDPLFLDPMTVVPLSVPTLTGVIDIKATWNATTALDANGDVFSWGQGGYTGDGDQLNDTLPQQVQGLNDVVAISGSTDGDHFLVLDAGRNCHTYGFFNLNTFYPEPFVMATNVIDIMAGETFSYIVKADGTLWAAGWSLCGSVFLDQPNHEQPNPQMEFIQLDPSAVAGSCPLVGTVAIPSATCSSGTITVFHFGGQPPYQYDIGSGPQNSNIFTDLPLGNYTVTVTDANGCVITVPCTVDPYDSAPIVVDMGAVSACIDEGFTFPSGTTVFTSGSYSDTTFSVIGCDTVRLFDVGLTGLPLLNWQITLCEGEPYTLPNGDVVYAPGAFFIDTLVNVGACDSIFTITLATLPPTVIYAYATDSTITVGESTLLISMAGESYSWFPSATLSCSDCQTPTATPTETTVYCVVLDDSNFCSPDTACVEIIVMPAPSPLCTAANIFVPTAFSPNASGKNDMQCVMGGECIATMTFAIYNRWGNKVFESTDPNDCWDGTYNGQALDPAAFVYHLSATMINGELLERQGNITLVR